MVIKVDHRDANGVYDFALWTFAGMGTDGEANLNFRVPNDELAAWSLQLGDAITFEWTNPDSGNMRWSLDVGLVDAENVR
jgi:hypothetical protein